MVSVMSFSSEPCRPRAPGSSPPWPGSITMVAMRATFGLSGTCAGASGRIAASFLGGLPSASINAASGSGATSG
ncbi:hypothetical protein D3C83_49420 [compost metagenome]